MGNPGRTLRCHWNELTPEEQQEERDKTARKYFERIPDWEYVGGFTDNDGKLFARHMICGTVVEKSAVSVRHNTTLLCSVCTRARKAKIKAEKRARVEERHQRSLERIEAKRLAREARKPNRTCPICGAAFRGYSVCCSDACTRKRNNQRREVKKRFRLRPEVVIDKGLTLSALFERDGGVCQICGEPCEWSDGETRSGTFIAGERYPSVDHIVPLSKGGKHAWSNVQLAHRSCNTWKRDHDIIPPVIYEDGRIGIPRAGV